MRLAAGFADSVPARATVGVAATLPKLSPRQTTTAQQISDALERYDLLLNVTLLVIACVVGVTVLWWNDAVWGGWKAYTTALLWGLGLHQVGGSASKVFPR